LYDVNGRRSSTILNRRRPDSGGATINWVGGGEFRAISYKKTAGSSPFTLTALPLDLEAPLNDPICLIGAIVDVDGDGPARCRRRWGHFSFFLQSTRRQ